MIYRDFPGGRMPALGLGTWRLEGDAGRRAVEHALAVGYRHLDTAQSYDNEAMVGQALRASGVPREEVFLTTKVWRDDLRPADIRRTTDDSLRRLGTDYVDLLLVHWPNPEVDLAETLETFQEMIHAGRAKHIGVSNFPPALLEEAFSLAPQLVCDQVEYHPFLAQDALLEVVRKHDAVLTAYSPLARGRVLRSDEIREIAGRHGKNPAQVTLRWFLQQDRVACIPKATSAEHIEANFDVLDFALSEDEMDRISGLAHGQRLIDPEFAPDWEAGG